MADVFLQGFSVPSAPNFALAVFNTNAGPSFQFGDNVLPEMEGTTTSAFPTVMLTDYSNSVVRQSPTDGAGAVPVVVTAEVTSANDIRVTLDTPIAPSPLPTPVNPPGTPLFSVTGLAVTGTSTLIQTITTGGAGGYTVLSLTVTATHVDVKFSAPVILTVFGAVAANWSISAGIGGYPVTATLAAQQASDTIRLSVTEMTNGITYTLHTVVGLVEDAPATTSNKAENKTFTGLGSAATILSAVAQSAKTILVTFDKVMHPPDLVDLTKFAVVGPAPGVGTLTIVAVGAASASSALLTTVAMEPYYLGPDFYTVTSTARTLAGN